MMSDPVPRGLRLAGLCLPLLFLALPTYSQEKLALEVGGGMAMPAFTDWSRTRNFGPTGAAGLSGRLNEGWGWTVQATWSRFGVDQDKAGTTDRFTSEPPGEVIVVTTSDIDGGAFSMIAAVAGLRRYLEILPRSSAYLTAGLALGGIYQDAATALRTEVVEGDTLSSDRVPWASDHSDVVVGLTVRIGSAIRITSSLHAFGEFGYEIAITPDDSFADNPDFFPVLLGIRKTLRP
jgi:hypothetical protein